MNYISAEQFQEQPKKVQEVLLKWWKPSNGDIFAFLGDDSSREIGVLGDLKEIQIATKGKGAYRIPLFTEGQLREFIEDKMNRKIDLSYYQVTGYDICLDNFNVLSENRNEWHLNLGTNLLQAYWQVACQIAKEVANE